MANALVAMHGGRRVALGVRTPRRAAPLGRGPRGVIKLSHWVKSAGTGWETDRRHGTVGAMARKKGKQ